MNTIHFHDLTKRLPLFVCTFAAVMPAIAFDVRTHTAMTAAAIAQSKITNTPNTSLVFKKLGLFDSEAVFGSTYVDLGSGTTRRSTEFEANIFRDVGNTQFTGLTLPPSLSIPGWIVRGAVREDDNTSETPEGSPAGDEPGGVFQRVFGHFYDPYNDRPLTVGFALGPRSPDWATVRGVGIGLVGTGRQNYYNLPSAREAMWRALTLKKWDNGTLTDAPTPSDWPNSTKEQLRKAYWATTFRALGDMVHLVQDAAQPQHTRNDAHSGFACVAYTGACVFGHASFVENYLAARTIQASQFTLPEGLWAVERAEVVRTTAPQLTYGGYPAPTFALARDYFSTATGAANATGKGLANYSNRGFFSFGTNLGATGTSSYPSPSAAGLVDSALTGAAVVNMTGQPIGAGSEIRFKEGLVYDPVIAESNMAKLTTNGVWDQFLLQKNLAPRYSLNHYNYDDQARLLIPRAVGYSAGLIDYFFRGELKIDLPDEGIYSILDHADPLSNCKNACGFTKIKLKLTNTTPDIVVSGGGPTVVNIPAPPKSQNTPPVLAFAEVVHKTVGGETRC